MTTQDLTVSESGLAFIKRYEGFRRRAARLADGRWVIGHSHTETAEDEMTVSRAEADALLRKDVGALEAELRRLIFAPVSQPQFDALASLAFSIGLRNFRLSSILKNLNEGRAIDAAAGFDVWRRARVDGRVMTLDALVRRRAAEKALFLQTDAEPVAAPSAELPVVADPDAVYGAPTDTPVRVDLDFNAPIAAAQVRDEAGGDPGRDVVDRLRQVFQRPVGRRPAEAASARTAPPSAPPFDRAAGRAPRAPQTAAAAGRPEASGDDDPDPHPAADRLIPIDPQPRGAQPAEAAPTETRAAALGVAVLGAATGSGGLYQLARDALFPPSPLQTAAWIGVAAAGGLACAAGLYAAANRTE